MTAPAEPIPAPATVTPTPRRWPRRLLKVALVLLALVLTAVAAIVVKMAPIGAAYSAKTLCSAVFLSGRDEASVVSEELDPSELSALLRLCHTEVDREDRKVRAWFFGGLISREAVYRPGLGATVVRGDVVPLPAPPAAPAAGAPTAPWPEGTAGVTTPVPALEAALDRAFAEPEPGRHRRRTRAVLVVHRGRLVAERYAPGFDVGTPQLGWSMTKTVTAALAGVLVRDGRWKLDEPVPVPEWTEPGDPRGRISLRDLLQMQSGLEFREEYSPLTDVTAMLFDAGDAGAYAAAKPLAHPPATRWSYSSGTTNILCRAMRETLGDEAYAAFPRGALFGPIGAGSMLIEPDSAGVFVGSSFGWATPRDWARFGLLLAQDGVWSGQRLLPEGWVDFLRTPALASGGRYGGHVWLRLGDPGEESHPPDTFHVAGHDRQLLTVIPSRQLVVLRMGLARSMRFYNHAELVQGVLAALPPESAPVSAPR